MNGLCLGSLGMGPLMLDRCLSRLFYRLCRCLNCQIEMPHLIPPSLQRDNVQFPLKFKMVYRRGGIRTPQAIAFLAVWQTNRAYIGKRRVGNQSLI